MSASKDLYESMGYIAKIEYEEPIFQVGQRFTIDYKINYISQKNLQGTWEIVDTKESPFYLCVRVLKNGKLSKSTHLNNRRKFYKSTIKQALEIKRNK
ncbi:hypothetical protein [Bacillus smithii]|uniref:hypothetical protein n=1 Tax=Bacillus smithii TaxID=1479 RepID=UPI003D1A8DBF